MRNGELVIPVSTDEMLLQALGAIEHTIVDLRDSSTQGKAFDHLAFLCGVSSIYLGLRPQELRPLLFALRELGGNITHGMIGKLEPGVYRDPHIPQDKGISELDMAFTSAEFDFEDPGARFGIIFNEETNEGEVFMSHPIIKTSPKLDLEVAKQRRRLEERGKGGFERIEEGFIHEDLIACGIRHSAIMAEDVPANSSDPEMGLRRKIWFTFSRAVV